ncbi:MAG: hypothetical protein MUF80_10355 [Burkholderiales bacterium]|jgi:hypothetical protein|nr:hypothetical protein [Burkholderiales bacterium]
MKHFIGLVGAFFFFVGLVGVMAGFALIGSVGLLVSGSVMLCSAVLIDRLETLAGLLKR